MNLPSKIKVHLTDIKRKNSLRFTFYRLLHIINRRISLPSHVFSGESDEIIFEKLLNPSENLIIVDIGANFGLWTLRYSKRYKIVHAFEPNPSTFAVLKRNTRRCKNVKLYCCALGDKNGLADFFVHERPGRNSFVRKLEDFKHTIRVPIKTLDDFDFDVGLIKIDTEGYELPILMGAKKTLENKKPQLYIEIHIDEQIKPILGLLKKYGYEYSIFNIRNNTQKMIITKLDGKQSDYYFRYQMMKSHRKLAVERVYAASSIDEKRFWIDVVKCFDSVFSHKIHDGKKGTIPKIEREDIQFLLDKINQEFKNKSL